MQTFSIGRDASNQIVLNDNFVSRHHAQIIFMDNGRILLKDLGSANGSFVNGNKVTETYLNPGDVVKIGGSFVNWSQLVEETNDSRIDLSAVANKANEWNNKFLSFVNPFLRTIDNGSFFRNVFSGIYATIAILNILVPIYVLFKAIDSDLFKAEGKIVLVFLLSWVVLSLLCWFGFQLWWNRKEKVNQTSYKGAEFVAIPVVAHFIQTIGEWYGVIVGVLGFLTGLLFFLMSSDYNYGFYGFENYVRPPFFGSGWQMIFWGPIAGFFIVVVFRLVAEIIKSVAAIANNTKKQV